MNRQVSNDDIKRMLRERARGADELALAEVLRLLAVTPQERAGWLGGRPALRALVLAALLTALVVGAALVLGYRPDRPPNSTRPPDGLAYSTGCAVVLSDGNEPAPNAPAGETLVPALRGGCPWPIAYDLSWSADGRFLAYSSGSNLKCGGCFSDAAQQAIADSGMWVLDTETDRRSQFRPTCVTDFCTYESTVISPDGGHLAYIFATSYWAMEIATGRTVELGRTPRVPSSAAIAWSPDSARLALIDDARKLSVVAVDGSAKTLVFDPGNRAVRDPAWSPAGQQIIFAVSGSDGGIRTVRPDGSGLATIGSAGGSAAHPTWAPDGQKIAYVNLTLGPGSGMWVMSADGADAHALEPDCSCAIGMTAPAWAPSGTYLAFVRGNSLYVAALDGGAPRLTDALPRFEQFGWSSPPPAWRPALPEEASE